MSLKNSQTSARARALGFRSGLEEKVAKCLTDVGASYVFEDPVLCCFNYYKTINKGTVVDSDWKPAKVNSKYKVVQLCQYTVDFAVLDKSTGVPLFYVETKGRFTSADRNKHKLIKQQYPDVDLRVLFQHDGKATPKMSYTQWCKSLNIPCGVIKPDRKSAPGFYFVPEWLEGVL